MTVSVLAGGAGGAEGVADMVMEEESNTNNDTNPRRSLGLNK